MLSKLLLLALLIALTLTGCGTPPAQSFAVAPPTAAPQPRLAPTAAPTAAPSDLAADLAATVTAQRAPTPTDGSTSTGVTVVALERDAAEQPLWAVVSTGMTLDTSHFVAIYARADSGWQELRRLTLDNPSTIASSDVAQVQFTPPDVWLAVRGSSALVGPCCYDMLRFDGAASTINCRWRSGRLSA